MQDGVHPGILGSEPVSPVSASPGSHDAGTGRSGPVASRGFASGNSSQPTGGAALGCLVLFFIAAIGASMLLSSFRFDSPGPTPYAVTVDSRWAGQTVVLTPDRPSADLTVGITTDASGVSPMLEATTPIGSISDPAWALTEPTVGVEVRSELPVSESCLAACELALSFPTCPSVCHRNVLVHVSLNNAAGRPEVRLQVRVGFTAAAGSPLANQVSVSFAPSEEGKP